MILVGYIHNGWVRAEFMESLLQLITELGGVASMAANGPYSVQNRNSLVEAFLGTDREWLLLLDSNIAFPKGIVDELLQGAEELDCKVMVVSPACMMVHRDVLKAIPRPWFGNFNPGSSEFLREDIYFCQRAEAAGFEIHVCPAIKLEHFEVVKIS